MDQQLQLAARMLQEQPTLESLRQYLVLRVRSGITPADYDDLIQIIGSVSPFSRDNWPWYSNYNEKYRAGLHRDILNLIVRIYPFYDFLRYLDNRQDAQDLCHLLFVTRNSLVSSQVHLVPVDTFADDYEPDYEDIEAHIRRHGLYKFPEGVAIDPDDGGSLACSIVTIIESFDPPAGIRHNICLEAEPSAGIFWSCHWRTHEPTRWICEGRGESRTFLPYKEYCDEHDQDLDQCICEACDAVGHYCNCEICDDSMFYVDHAYGYEALEGCGKYHNRNDEHLPSLPKRPIKPELRCQCFDICPGCGKENVMCECGDS